MMDTSGGRAIVLGVGAGIAAYKSCELLRRLQDAGYDVTVVPTPASLNFVGTATWEALSGKPVYTQVWENIPAVPHISLAQTSELIVIAPATADLIARLAVGRADDLLTNLVLASTKPKLVVPAMHPGMWANSATVANVKTLRERGFTVMEPAVGRLTGKDFGQGRFPESAEIIAAIAKLVFLKEDLLGLNILISAGGTREAIDPVRFIGNRSSGKQGIALARAAAARGARTTLIAANIDLNSLEGVEIIHCESALEMAKELELHFPTCDALIMSAAVADVRPSTVSASKIKKSDLSTISLVANPDILMGLISLKKKQIVIGFAAETSNFRAAGELKLRNKGLDVIYINDVTGGAIFGADDTEGTLLTSQGEAVQIPLVSKETLANILLDTLLTRLG